MWFPACKTVVGCSGTNSESVSFFRKGQANLFNVILTAWGRMFPAPLSSTPVTVTLSLDDFDNVAQANCTARRQNRGVPGSAATCRKK
jgi:hypothetical protein